MLSQKMLSKAREKNNALTIADIRRASAATNLHSLFVFNNTDMAGKREPGALNIPITVDGQSQNIRVPDTFIPIDLSQFGDLDAIARSPSFANAIQKGHIIPVTENFAREILESDVAKEEAQRLELESASGVQSESGEEEVVRLEEKVNPRVLNIVLDSDKSDTEKRLAFYNIQGLLTEEDCRYIMLKTSNEGIKALITERLREIDDAKLKG